MITKECKICGKQFVVVNTRQYTAKYCSPVCNGRSKKGKKTSEETKKKLSLATKKSHENGKRIEIYKKISESKKGHNVSMETRKKLSKFMKGRHHSPKTEFKGLSGKDSPNWRGGISQDIEHYRRLRREREKNAIGSYTSQEWNDLKKKYNYTCPICKKREPRIKLTVDHFHPLTKGGTSYIENIQPLCRSCNSRKSNKVLRVGNNLVNFLGKPTFLPIYSYRAKCKRVIDCDTIICEWVDLGFSIFLNNICFRFNRIDAYESRTKDLEEKKKGLKGKKWLKKQIEGKEIIVESYKDRQKDAFGRYLAEVWLDGVNLNDLAVKLGHAIYKSY